MPHTETRNEAQWRNLNPLGESADFTVTSYIMNVWLILTLLDGQVAHGERHGVTGEDVISAVHVHTVDGQASADGDSNHTSHIF